MMLMDHLVSVAQNYVLMIWDNTKENLHFNVYVAYL